MGNKAVTPVKTTDEIKTIDEIKNLDEIKKAFANSTTGFDADVVLREGDKELSDGEKSHDLELKSSAYKALTLFEFDKGILLCNAVSELFRVFAVDFLRKLRAEFNCQTPSENALAENVTLNFVRTLQIQQAINNVMSKDTIPDFAVNFLQVMSQELDRANRHFLASMQTLKVMRQPTMQVNIKTETAVVGQNQIVQANNNHE